MCIFKLVKHIRTTCVQFQKTDRYGSFNIVLIEMILKGILLFFLQKAYDS